MFRKKTANVSNILDYIVMQMRKANREKGYCVTFDCRFHCSCYSEKKAP